MNAPSRPPPPTHLPRRPSRRRWFVILAVVVAAAGAAYWLWTREDVDPLRTEIATPITAEERELLELVARRAFDYFIHEINPDNGLVKDRAHAFEKTPVDYAPASIAGTGYALSAYCIGEMRGWITRDEAYNRCLTALRFLLKVPTEHGFYYHFMEMKTGVRTWKSELSSIDSTLMFAGLLHAAAHFPGTEVEDLAWQIYRRVDWPWMMNNGPTMMMGWNPEHGFDFPRWDHYCESMLLYILAIGSPTHPIPAETWNNIARPIGRYGDYTCIVSPPLFTHQYSHIWIDFRNRYDNFADYFENSRQATLANRQFCIDEAPRFRTYGPDVWGLTASQAPDGYHAYGAKPGLALHDGTIAPTGAIGSIVFTPRESIDFIKKLYREHPELWGQYGFVDAFNFDKDWYSREVLAIDQGTILLMIDNFLHGSIWKEFMTIPEIRDAMKKAGFREGKKEFDYTNRIFDYFSSDMSQRPTAEIPWEAGVIRVDGDTADWSREPLITLTPTTNLERGTVENTEDIRADIRLAYDEKNLYLLAVIRDDQLVRRTTGTDIHRDDAIELYIDPANDNLTWGSSRDFQIGLAAGGPDAKAEKWFWFQQDDGGAAVTVASSLRERDYVIEAAIPWSILGITPDVGYEFSLTPAIHDRDLADDAKLTWFFHEPGIILGKVKLGGR